MHVPAWGFPPDFSGVAQLTRKPAVKAEALSLVIHALVIVAVLLPAFEKIIVPPPKPPGPPFSKTAVFTPSELRKALGEQSHGGGSGGEGNPIPTTGGKLAPFSWVQFTPPTRLLNPNPGLSADSSLLGPPEIKVPDLPNTPFGIPGVPMTDSVGPGHGGGFGNKCCVGQGLDGEGRGAGPGEEWSTGGGPPNAGTRSTSFPTCLYCPNPVYPDEARKAKVQGSVLLRVVVTPDGRATNVTIVKGLGLGLEERAIEAVKTWRFTPSIGPDGRRMAVVLPIEVNFRLL